MDTHKLIIIGSGPAGHTAAIYASRADLNPVMLEGHEPGGQLTTTTDVDNFPGFPDGITGPDLMANMKKQALRFGTKYMSQNAVKVDTSKRPFLVSLENGEKLSAESLIISTGASAKYLGLEQEKELIGKGVSACATCDGFFYRNKIVYVVGGGDTAIEEATFLTKFAKKVYIVHRRDTLRASKPMQARAFANPKIEMIWDSAVEKLISDNTGLIAINIKNLKTDTTIEHKLDGLFMGIGHRPNTAFLDGALKLDDHGFIITHGKQETSIEGIFACGDVQDSFYRQAISAAGTGCMSAIAAEKFLEANKS